MRQQVTTRSAWRGSHTHCGVDIVGPENDDAIVEAARDCEPIICAWGVVAAPLRWRIAQVRAQLAIRAVFALGLSGAGDPKHPLARGRSRVPNDAQLVPLTPATATSATSAPPDARGLLHLVRFTMLIALAITALTILGCDAGADLASPVRDAATKMWRSVYATKASLYAVWSSGPDDVWVAGEGIYHSVDGGKSWVVSTRNIGTHRAIWGSGPDDVWVAGEGVYHSVDGGKSWILRHGFGVGRGLHAIFGFGRPGGSTIFIGGEAGEVSRSQNAGRTWELLPIFDVRKEIIAALWGTSEKDLFAVGSLGNLWRFGGMFWSPRVVLYPDGGLYALSGDGRGLLWAVGAAGAIFHSADGGRSWERQVSGTALNLFGVGPGVAVGTGPGGQGGIILRWFLGRWRTEWIAPLSLLGVEPGWGLYAIGRAGTSGEDEIYRLQ